MGIEPLHQHTAGARSIEHHARRHRLSKPRLVIAAAVFVGLYMLSHLNFNNIQRWCVGHAQRRLAQSDATSGPESIWDSIKPSKDLEWHECYKEFPGTPFKCARLTVPMDYDDPAAYTCSSPKVHIALILNPGKEASSKSPMLINPGGPGGMGTTAALLMSPAMKAIFGDDQPVIGFDPRGIGYTTPLADCWSTPPPAFCDGCPEDPLKGLQHRVEWLKENSAYGTLNSSSVSLKFLNAGQRAVNKLCTTRDARLGDKSILAHVSTTHVARDMLSIVDAWDRWVDAQADANGLPIPANPTQGKLVYWGFSYGTYLGATFASLFPDRVGRVMLDGVVDAELYQAPYWAESLLDTDKILDLFFEFCVEKGKGGGCDLYRSGDAIDDVGQRFRDIMDRVEYGSPITFTHPEHFFPVILPAVLFKTLTFSILYSPVRMFPALATMMNYLYEEKYEAFSDLFADLAAECTLPEFMSIILNDAQRAIMCSDKSKPVNQTDDEIRSTFEQLASTSQFADIWMGIMMQCNGWDIYRDSNPPAWPHPPAAGIATTVDNQIKTAFPLLFLSNTLDPVTPLHAAIKMSQKFASAGLLEQKSAGHCTISTASRCTAKIMRKYILHGEVPPPPRLAGVGEHDRDDGEWTTCEADEKIGRSFVLDEGSLEEMDVADGWEEGDRELVEALLTIQGALAMMPTWETRMGAQLDLNTFQTWGDLQWLKKQSS